MFSSLDFLYWSLGAGFIIFIFFSCIALFYIIRILKDFADISDHIKDTTEKVNKNVAQMAEKINQTTDQITQYIVRPFSFFSFFMERIRPFLESFQQKADKWQSWTQPPKNDEKDDDRPKKKRKFGRGR